MIDLGIAAVGGIMYLNGQYGLALALFPPGKHAD
jgi:hypothetical protein